MKKLYPFLFLLIFACNQNNINNSINNDSVPKKLIDQSLIIGINNDVSHSIKINESFKLQSTYKNSGEAFLGEKNIGSYQENSAKKYIFVGNVLLKFEKNIDLNGFLKKYNGKVIDKIKVNDDFLYNICFDLKDLNLNLIDKYSETDLSFSSLDTLKTYFLSKKLQDNPNIKQAFLEKIMVNTGIDNQIITNEGSVSLVKDIYTNSGQKFNLNSPQKSIDSWWLNDSSLTNITRAWNYSLGNNVTVAVFDRDFGKVDQYPDFDSRVDIRAEYLSHCRTPVPLTDKLCSSYQQKPGHGFRVMSLLGANYNDSLNIAGVAPKVKMVPISIFSSWDFLKKLAWVKDYKDKTTGKGIDLVNISSGLKILRNSNNNSDCINDSRNGEIICSPEMVNGQILVNEINQQGIIIIAASGNHGLDINETNEFHFPSGFDNVISVGAYEFDNISSGNIVRADFYPKSFATRNFINGSNYGRAVDIWAPGDNLPIQVPLDVDDNSREWVKVGGTSFATPIVTGVVSLLRAWRSDFSVDRMRLYLQQNGTKLNHDSFNNSNNASSFAINALKSLQNTNSCSSNVEKVCSDDYEISMTHGLDMSDNLPCEFY